MRLISLQWFRLIVMALATTSFACSASADGKHDLEDHEVFYVDGWPAAPSDEWVMAIGGRLYDNWINMLSVDGPEDTHPAWPAANTKKSGATTWRCKSCHGWDLKGKDGKYASGSYQTGIIGVQGVQNKDPNAIQDILMNDTHGFTHDMIPVQYMKWLTAFLSKGQYDIADYVNDAGDVSGDANRGKGIFQNVCASCHGYNGTALDWGDEGDPAYVGTEANANPWEVFFKIRHGHPGAEMVAMVAFGPETVADILAYTKTLPQQ